MPNYYDVHAHLADNRIWHRRQQILEAAGSAGVKGILAAAARRVEWEPVVELTSHPLVYGAVGLHPFFIEQWDDDAIAVLRHIVRSHKRIVAVGEVGLDFYRGREEQEAQMQVLAQQLLLAADEQIPVILHNRKSWSEFFGLLRELNLNGVDGVCHHFTGSREIARQALDKGLYLSFCGPLTYDNARRIKDAASYAPMERILTETDTPDLPVQRHRGEYSYPHHVEDIVDELAHLKGCSPGEVANAVEKNFRRLLLGG